MGKMFNFVEIYRFVVNPLTISQKFISISCFIKKLLQKRFGGVTQPLLAWARVKQDNMKIFSKFHFIDTFNFLFVLEEYGDSVKGISDGELQSACECGRNRMRVYHIFLTL